MDEYFTFLSKLISQYAYVAIFVFLLLENTAFLGFIVPGLLVLLIAGFFSGNGELNLAGSLIAGILGTMAGDNLSYLLGKYGVQKIYRVREFVQRDNKVSEILNSQKSYVLVFFQFPVYLRVVMPAVLGSMSYPFKRWLIIDTVGSFLFNATFMGLGFAVAKTTGLFTDASTYSSRIQYAFGALFVFWILAVLWKFYKSRKT